MANLRNTDAGGSEEQDLGKLIGACGTVTIDPKLPSPPFPATYLQNFGTSVRPPATFSIERALVCPIN